MAPRPAKLPYTSVPAPENHLSHAISSSPVRGTSDTVFDKLKVSERLQ